MTRSYPYAVQVKGSANRWWFRRVVRAAAMADRSRAYRSVLIFRRRRTDMAGLAMAPWRWRLLWDVTWKGCSPNLGRDLGLVVASAPARRLIGRRRMPAPIAVVRTILVSSIPVPIPLVVPISLSLAVLVPFWRSIQRHTARNAMIRAHIVHASRGEIVSL